MSKEKTPSYFYIGNKAPTKTKSISIESKQKNENNEKNLFNPLFNFDKTFGNNFDKVTPLDLAQSQPYIALKIVNLDGKTIHNLNVDFFQKQIDFEKIKNEGRHTERPLISLKQVTISTDQSTGGYIYFTKVQLELKVHKKDDLSDRAVLGLLFPGCPLRLEYGWSNNLKTVGGEFLNNSRENILLNVVSYDITLDETGQADLIVDCMAYNDIFDNVIIGDLTSIKSSNENIGEKESNTLHVINEKLNNLVSYLESLKEEGKANTNDYSLIRDQLESYRTLQQKTEGEISKNFTKYLESLSDEDFRSNFSFGKRSKILDIEVVSFHDVIAILCDETFKSMTSLMPVSKFEVIYGSFNDQCLDYSGKCIADFPIDYNKFTRWISQMASNGQKTFYVKSLLNSLCAEFIENPEYIRQSSNSQAGTFLEPDIIINFVNDGEVLYLHIADANSGIPPTSNQIKDLKKASSKEAQDKILNGVNIPIVSIGSANSYVKGVNFSRIDDANMEAVLIERSLNNSSATPRSGIFDSKLQTAQAVGTPLTLPLQGTARVIGHRAWKPFRAFYLSSGIFLIDAIYLIKKVTHVLSSEGFETQVEFIWH
jgi:hypothetical protein